MSNYAVVHAEFPEINPANRESIYESLEKAKWIKFHTSGEKTLFTTWYAKFKDDVIYDRVINASKNDFINSAKPYNVIPSLIIHVGPNMPYIEIEENNTY